jgi:hypothetical protein
MRKYRKYIIIIVVALIGWVVYRKYGESIKSTVTNITA